MDACSVKILPENIEVTVRKGISLLAAIRQGGVEIVAPCGGNGICGKCTVRVIEGNTGNLVNSLLPLSLREKGYVLACKTQVTGRMVVEIPEFSRLSGHKVVVEGRSVEHTEGDGSYAAKPFSPLCRKLQVRLDKPGPDNSMSDLERLKKALFMQYGIDKVGISLECLRILPLTVRKAEWELTVIISSIGDNDEIISVEPGIREKPAYGLAVDIGTTTVAVSLIDLDTGNVIDRIGAYNSQSQYGSDVISRIIYTDEHPDGLETMNAAVVNTINELAARLTVKHALENTDIFIAVCAGNTVMSHFFMKVPATYLRLEPYVPGAVKFPAIKAEDLGLSINPNAYVVTLPSVASYVGGDITSGVLASGLAHTEELTLFIDVGTNGELVLGNSDWLVTCSCSAGPAFEGSGVSCGMRAVDGAISRIEIDRNDCAVRYGTVGDARPVGICGSGLIQSLSEMAGAGIIDRAGRIVENRVSDRVRKSSEGMEYVVVFADDTGNGQDIVITEGDIKNLLRAKGAIFAGIRTMLRQLQLEVDEIQKVYIAGGFGSFIDIPDAVSIGMLPDLTEEKYEFIGNSSLQGAELVLLHTEALIEADAIADRMTYLELSIGNTFMDEFVSALFIPHTDLDLFRSVVRHTVKEL